MYSFFTPTVRFAPSQAVQYALGYTYPFLGVSLVVSANASSSSASFGTCTDVGTGLALPSAYFEKAPYPQEGGAYAGRTIAISLVSTVAAYVLSAGSQAGILASTSAAFNVTAAALAISPTYPGGDLSMCAPCLGRTSMRVQYRSLRQCVILFHV